MNAQGGPGPGTARARRILETTIQGAQVNDRVELVERLSAARRLLDDPTLPGRSGQDRTSLPGPAADGRVSVLHTVGQEVLRAVDTLEADLRARRAMLADPARAARLQAELQQARDRSERFQGRSREWSQVLLEGFAAVNSDVEFDLRTRVRTVVGDAEKAIDEGDPAKNWNEFDNWLRSRLAEEAAASFAVLRTGTRRIAAQVAALLQLSGPEAIHPLPVAPPEGLLADLPRQDPSTGTSTPAPTRMMAVLMPAYGGIMMTLVPARFLGLELPGWLIAVCALLGALGLGGAALSGERKRQLDRRRSQAKAVVRSYTEWFLSTVGKQARDTSRAVQQDLRRGCAARTTTIAASFSAAVEQARRDADAASRVDEGLADIADDLGSLEKLRREARSLVTAAPDGVAASSGESGPSRSRDLYLIG